MSQEDIVGDAIERLEWDERKAGGNTTQELASVDATDRADRRCGRESRRAALEACGSSKSTTSAAAATSSGGSGPYGSSGGHKFVMVNHVTTNSFFTATIYGCQDACALTGSSFQWTGSNNSIVSEMVSAFNTAHRGKGERDRVRSDRQHRVQRTRRHRR